MKDYYEALGLDRSATQEEIKKTFKKLSKEHHPDAGGDEDRFKEVSEAYETLGDPEKRAVYDKFGVEGENIPVAAAQFLAGIIEDGCLEPIRKAVSTIATGNSKSLIKISAMNQHAEFLRASMKKVAMKNGSDLASDRLGVILAGKIAEIEDQVKATRKIIKVMTAISDFITSTYRDGGAMALAPQGSRIGVWETSS